MWPIPRRARGQSGERFGHADVVAWDLEGYVGSEGSSPGFVIAEVAVKGRKRNPRANDAEVDGPATGLPKVVFGGIHHFATEPGSLPQGIHAKQPQVTSVTVNLNVDASGQARGILSDEKCSFGHIRANASGINAIALDEGLLDAKSGVDQAGERIHIDGEGGTNVNAVRRASIAGIGHKREFCLLPKMARPRLV